MLLRGFREGAAMSRILPNIAANAGFHAWMLLLNLVAIPLFVRRLGVEAFGALALANVIVAQVALLDLGLSNALVKFLTDARSVGDRPTMQRLVSTAMSVYLVLGTAGALGLAVFSLWAGSVFSRWSPELVATMSQVLRLSGCAFLINLPALVFVSLLVAAQRLDRLNLRKAIAAGVVYGGQMLAVTLGAGLPVMVGIGIFGSGLLLLMLWWAARQEFPEVSFIPGFNRPAWNTLIGFGSLKTLNTVASQIAFNVDRLIIGAMLPAAWVSYTVVPLDLLGKLSQGQFTVSNAYFPAACSLAGDADRERFFQLYLRTCRLLAVVLLPIFLPLSWFGRPLLAWWIGPEFAVHGGPSMAIFALAYAGATLTHIPTITAEALGKPGMAAVFGVSSASAYVLGIVLLVPAWHGLAPAVSLAVTMAWSVPGFLYFVNTKTIGLPIARFLREALLKPLVAGTALMVPAFLDLSSRGGSALAALVASLFVYSVLCLFLGAVEKRDVERLWRRP